MLNLHPKRWALVPELNGTSIATLRAPTLSKKHRVTNVDVYTRTCTTTREHCKTTRIKSPHTLSLAVSLHRLWTVGQRSSITFSHRPRHRK